MEREEMKAELRLVINELDEFSKLLVKVVEGLRQAINNDAAITTLDDLKKALPHFASARKIVETAKRLIKDRIQERIKG